MRLDDAKDREHGALDLLVLSATVCLALATWANLAEYFRCFAVEGFRRCGETVLLAQATLTRNLDWAMAIRFLTGGWLVAAPFVLGFYDVAPALWSYLVIGTLVATAATPGIAGRLGGRSGMAA